MYRNAAILDYARLVSCQNCGRHDGTVVAAHSNQSKHGKGLGIKAHDCFVAYLCAECHYLVDQSRLPRDVRLQVWETAHGKSVPLFAHLLTAEGWRLIRSDHA